ncbi:winged helix-turn-helix domain-containing protein [Ignicoccus hospitalis]|uniref:winged helix-turn-helix domain-containing protein n=1 Tax=Ignicoccus hospitalis TaxID=160233 RepID=UPI00164FDCF4|nr:winged helix-turn-helix domain-containing protein [Ignicoccus hospitalis]
MLPLLLCFADDPSSAGELSTCLGLPSSRTKTLIYYARKAGYIKKKENTYELTEKGKELVESFEVVERKGKRLKVKGKDGCFLVFVRKRNVKVLRVPCS